jgi:uncharacterized protein with von Willebrand factor type A (vWA) domain
VSNFELNRGDQFIIALDASGSMQTKDCPGNTDRFSYVLETMRAFVAEAAKWDPDGVSFYVFNSELKAYQDVATIQEIDEKIAVTKPRGGTNTHLAIEAAYKEHKAKQSDQTFLLVFTDGEPTNPGAVKKSIVDITNNVQDEKEFRVAFLTVGERSPELETWLKDLDDNLTDAKYDIVTVDKLEDVDFETAVADAIDG